MDICVTDSLWYIAETKKTLQINYTTIKIKKKTTKNLKTKILVSFARTYEN